MNDSILDLYEELEQELAQFPESFVDKRMAREFLTLSKSRYVDLQQKLTDQSKSGATPDE